MKEVKASELNSYINFNKNGPTYLCKICENTYTYNEDGICDICKDGIDYDRNNHHIEGLTMEEAEEQVRENGFVDFDEYMDTLEKQYSEMENIKIIDDISLNTKNIKERMIANYEEKELINHYLKNNAFEEEINKLKEVVHTLEEIHSKVYGAKETLCDKCTIRSCSFCRIQLLTEVEYKDLIKDLNKNLMKFGIEI